MRCEFFPPVLGLSTALAGVPPTATPGQRALDALEVGLAALAGEPMDPVLCNAQARMLRKKAFIELRQRRPQEAMDSLTLAGNCLADHPLHPEQPLLRLALGKLRVTQVPDVEQPVLTVGVTYPGASPETVEREVVNRIEKALQGISGIYQVRSTSSESFGQIVLFFNFNKNMVEAADEKQLARTIARYGRVDLLCIDELGYMELDRRGAELLFQVLTEREEKNSVAIASNESFSGWTRTFTDPRLCAAIVDRLTFGGSIIETGTDSYRLAHTLSLIHI